MVEPRTVLAATLEIGNNALQLGLAFFTSAGVLFSGYYAVRAKSTAKESAEHARTAASEVVANHGTSLRDAVDRVEATQGKILNRLMLGENRFDSIESRFDAVGKHLAEIDETLARLDHG